MADPYLTPDDLRNRDDFQSAHAFTETDLEALIAEFEQVAEEYRGVAFTERDVTGEIHEMRGGTVLLLDWPQVTTLTAIELEGVAFPADGYELNKKLGRIDFYYPVTGTIDVDYSHGFTTADYPQVTRACRQYVRSCALSDLSNTPRDVIATSQDGFVQRFSTPDKRAGRPTGWIEVDRLLNSLPNYRRYGLA